ncbi:MAG: ATP-binding protein [Chloroflexia bacterium]
MPRLSLLKQFSIISLALFLAIGSILGWGLTQHFERQAIEQQTLAVTPLVQPLLGDFLNNEDFLKNGAIEDTTKPNDTYSQIEGTLGLLGGSGLARVRIWNREGKVIYSDFYQQVGDVFPVTPDLVTAFDGETTAEISPLDKAENVEERGYGELLEIYAPLRRPGVSNEVDAVFEGYYDIADLREKINVTNEFLWASIITGFLFLFVSLFTIVRNASQRIFRQSYENGLLLRDTERKAARLEVVNELARSINSSSLDLTEVFQTALRGIDRVLGPAGMGSTAARITLLDERAGAGEVLEVSHGDPEGLDIFDEIDVDLKKKLLGSGDTFLSSDTRLSSSPELVALSRKGMLSLLFSYIGSNQRRLGIVCVASVVPGSFNEEDASILKGVADQLAVAIENSRLIKETAETTALRETNRLKDEFVSMVSHELRTPLASIKGYSRTLLAPDGNWDDATRDEFLTIISEESDKLADLVENLLEMSRIEAGRLPINAEPILLKRFCKEVVDRVCNHYPDMEFKCDLDDPLPMVMADPRRVEQVLVNLLQNAAKYSGAQIICVNGSYDGGALVTISVEDSGAGIGAEHLPHLFDKFFRVEAGQGHKEVGTGLGLTIVKALVEAQGGKVWVKSAPGEGTTFFFTLPVLMLDGAEDGEM